MESEQDDGTEAYVKFRRAARAVMLIQRVCRICKDLVYEAICSEEWYAKMDSFLACSTGLTDQPKHVRPFTTLISNEKRQLIQLTFDRSKFFKERRVDLTDDMRALIQTKAEERTLDQTNEILRFLKRASPKFNSFQLDSQRKMVHCMWFDTYAENRVITKQGSQADSIFFVLSGRLVEKAKDRQQLREIKQGEGFGEEDLKCACPRRTTVLTQTTVELITIHRQDYRAILNMCDDSNDPKYLEICKHDLVFRHFPVHKLEDNPGVWTVLSYKFGCLMVKDSNEMEWIYIIKSGEARIIKHLAMTDFNLVARRKAIEDRRNEESPYFRQKQLVDFVAKVDNNCHRRENEPTSAPTGLSIAQRRRRQLGILSSIGGRYSSAEFGEGDTARSGYTCGRSTGNSLISSSPLRHQGTNLRSGESRLSAASNVRPQTTASSGNRNKTRYIGRKKMAGQGSFTHKPRVKINIENLDANGNGRNISTGNGEVNDNQALPSHITSTPRSTTSWTTDSCHSPRQHLKGTKTNTNIPSNSTSPGLVSGLAVPGRSRYLATSLWNRSPEGTGGEDQLTGRLPFVTSGTPSTAISAGKVKTAAHMVKVPPFVQLEALTPGKVFGLRSCLEPDERGPSASLVSGGCEVLQINKKFFMKHIDEAIISLIRLTYKAMPSEDELVDRLDGNIRWDEYKQNTVLEFMRERGRDAKGYNTAFVSVS